MDSSQTKSKEGGREGLQKKTLTKKLLYSGVVLVGLLVCELAIGLFWPQATWSRITSASIPTETDEVIPWRLVPSSNGALINGEFEHTISVNSHGYRGPELDEDPKDGYRVLAVGDSFTFGWGVADGETWPYLLQTELGKGPTQEPLEVINAGFSAGFRPDTYYLYLKEYGLKLKPDVVLIGLFLGNDIEPYGAGTQRLEWAEVDARGLPTRIERDPEYRVKRANLATPQRRYRYPFLRNSHLIQGLISAVRNTFPPPSGVNQWMYRNVYTDRTNERIARVQKLLVATHALCTAQGARCIVILMPTREQVYPDEYDFASLSGVDAFDLAKPQRVLSAFLKANAIPHIDLLSLLLADGTPTELYYPIDLHWTPKGTAWVARTLAKELPAQIGW